MEDKYSKIIALPHHESKTHKKMDRLKRAAQFSPFAALTGFDQAILETSRLTKRETQPMEDKLEMLNHKFEILMKYNNPLVKITYFQEDKNKEGGEYLIKVGEIKKIDIDNRKIIFVDQSFIYFNKVSDIECELFDDFIF